MSGAVTVNEGQQKPDLLTQYLGNLGLPAFIITTLFPGLFGKVSKYPRAVRLLTIPLVLWLASNFLIGKLLGLWRKIMSNAMSSVVIASDDFYLYTAFKSWLSKQKMMMLEKAISAQSVFYLRNKGQDGRTIEKELANNKSIVFDPQNKFQLFRHQGRFFLLTMDTKQMIHTSMDKTEMKIWCLGLSPRPIENLLLDVYDSSRSQDNRTLTTIMTPYGGRQWNRRCIKSSRPLSSVYLETEQKNRLIADITEYLAPSTAKWYQDRGIPYRRGYLFHGSPGCGKTSLAVALAGHFRLDVYIVSLLDLEVSDSALLQLFQAVRSGVLVLLEDVDSAGLGREVEEPSAPNNTVATTGKARPNIAEKKAAKLQASRITLSGLLNAIDGAGAPEGHVLVMTTNTPDALDEALVRPGRIDVKVEFRKSTRGQVKEIFVNMYRPTPSFDNQKNKRSTGKDKEGEEESEAVRQRGEHQEKEAAEEVERLAEEFAERVPDERFSPAELQDYILLRKDQPRRAVDEVQEWVRRELGLSSMKEKDGNAAIEQDGDKSQQKHDNEPLSRSPSPSMPRSPASEGEGEGDSDGETPASSVGDEGEKEL